jgi:hypothetical protein
MLSMGQILRWQEWLPLAIVLAALPFAAGAQTLQVLPEIDVYYRFNSNVRVYFQDAGGRRVHHSRNWPQSGLSCEGAEQAERHCRF